MDGFGRSLDRGYEANTKTDNSFESQNWRPFGPESYSLVLGAPSETTSFHLIIEKPRCLLLGSIDAPHTRVVLLVREGEAVHNSVASSLFGRVPGCGGEIAVSWFGAAAPTVAGSGPSHWQNGRQQCG